MKYRKNYMKILENFNKKEENIQKQTKIKN